MPKKKNYQRKKYKSKSTEKNKDENTKTSEIENEENNSTNKNNNEFKDFDEEEINDFKKELKYLINDSSEPNGEEIEGLDIKEDEDEQFEDFSRGDVINDIEYLKEDLDKIIQEKNNLNNQNNPFIKERKKFANKKNKLEQDSQKKKEKIIQDIEMKEINIKNLKEEKYYINDLFIEKSNKIYDENNIIIYKTLIYAGKKFKIMTKTSNISETNEITYYCTLHRTIKNSQEFYDNNKKKKINLCDGKIIYNKNIDKFYLANNHSLKCDEFMKKKIENYKEINIEINNYKNFRLGLIEFLKINPLISYKDFLKEALKIYDKNNCTFQIKNNTFSNLYYNWRKTSNIFTKFSVYSNKYTNNNEIYLRDYTFKNIYTQSGKKSIYHEHIIYISNYFIKKLRDSEHYYIDGTFIYPNGFKQLIVILYYEKNSLKRYPGLFALINNKTENGYKEMFKSIFNILTIEYTRSLKLKSITTDFEPGLINALNQIVPDVRKVGCFYHFVRAIKQKIKSLHILNIDNTDKDNLLNDIFMLPFSFKTDEYTNADSFCNKYEKLFPEFINYFKRQWLSYFKNGFLNYSYLKKDFRSNSYIENYNRRIKLKLSKYLYGKSKVKISWPLFFYFIRSEEEEYRNDNINYENSLEFKYNIKNVNSEKYKINKKNINKIKETNKRKWLSFNNFSCRYDTFTFIYTFSIKNILTFNENNIGVNEIIELYNNITNDILSLTEDELNRGIWNIIDRYKKNYQFLNQGYQEYYTIRQLFNNFDGNEQFCFKYTCLEGCTNCMSPKETLKYLPVVISFDNNYIHMFDIVGLIYNHLKNSNSVCFKCGYKEDYIIDENIKNYYTVITKVECPKIIIIGFEFSLPEDLYNSKNELNSIETMNIISYNRLKNNIEIIKRLCANEFTIYNSNYSLKGLACCPYAGHYNGLIINLFEDCYLLKKNYNYFYDDMLNNNTILEITGDWRKLLNNNIPNLLIYIKQ